jgi:hypothetical protein
MDEGISQAWLEGSGIESTVYFLLPVVAEPVFGLPGALGTVPADARVFFLSALGFLASRLLLFWPFAIAVLLSRTLGDNRPTDGAPAIETARRSECITAPVSSRPNPLGKGPLSRILRAKPKAIEDSGARASHFNAGAPHTRLGQTATRIAPGLAFHGAPPRHRA